MNFNKNKLINEVMDHNFETWSHTLNTADFVSPKFLMKIDNMIFVELKKQLKQAEIYNYLYLQDNGYKLSFFQKLKIYFSGLKPLYKAEKLREEQERKEQEEEKAMIRDVIIKNATVDEDELLPTIQSNELKEIN